MAGFSWPVAVAAFAVGIALPRASPAARAAVADATATVVRSADPVSEAASVLLSSTPGVLTIMIPGALGSESRTLIINSGGRPSGVGTNSVVLSLEDAQALNAVIAELRASGGTLTLSGQLSGKGVQIVVTKAATCAAGCEGEAGAIVAMVTYN